MADKERKIGKPTVITKQFAQTVDCSKLYQCFKAETGAANVVLAVQGIEVDEDNGYHRKGGRVYVPSEDRKLDDFCPSGFTHYLVTVDYTIGPLSPDQLMTRGEFVIELLNIWETMLGRIRPHMKDMADEIETVMGYVRNAYATNELIDLTYLEQSL